MSWPTQPAGVADRVIQLSTALAVFRRGRYRGVPLL